MKKIVTLVVSIDDNEVRRDYILDSEPDDILWGRRVLDMLDTLKQSEVIEF